MSKWKVYNNDYNVVVVRKMASYAGLVGNIHRGDLLKYDWKTLKELENVWKY